MGTHVRSSIYKMYSYFFRKQFDFEKELKSFVDIASDIEHQTISSSMMEFGLSFDRKYYKANTEVSSW